MSPNRKQLLALILTFLLSISAIGQTKDYIYFGDRLLAIETVGSGCGINAAYLSNAGGGSIRLSCHGSPSTVYDSGGVVNTAPNAHQNAAQDVFIASLVGNTAWVITFNTATATWGTWADSNGVFAQNPAIAAAPDNTTAYLVGKDNWTAYAIRRYSKTSGFTAGEPWVGLGGVWSSEPAVTVASTGLVYIFGVDLWGGMWYGQYNPSTRTVTWAQSGTVAGTPAVTSTTAGVYALAREYGNNNVWLARVDPTSNTITWFNSGAVVNGPLSLAASNQTVWAASSVNGSVFYNSFLEGSSSWSQWNWPATGGVLSSLSVASTQGNLYLAGRDPNTLLWWYTPGGGWVQYSSQGIGPGVSATPR